MTTMIRIAGAFFIAVGLLALFDPELVLLSLDWESRSGQIAAVALRVGFGAFFLIAARSTRYQSGMRVLGAIGILSGLAYLVIPADSWTDLMQWLDGEGQGTYRLGAAVGGSLAGAFLISASKPESGSA